MALELLRYFNLGRLYAEYSAIVDFFIYLVVFVGLVRATFEKRFEGTGGKALIAGLGTALALGLSIAESKYGFNLGSFGGIAVAILVTAFGFLLFSLLSSIGLHKSTAFALAYLMLFIFLNSISQRLSLWIQGKFPILNLLFLLAFLFVIVKGFSSFGGSDLKNSAQSLLRKGAEYARQIPLREEKLERKVLREEAKNIHQEMKISSKMVKQLYEIKSLIRDFGATEQGRKAIAEQLTGLSAGENKLLQKLQFLQTLDKKLMELDVLAIRKLKDEFGQVPDGFKAEVDKEIRAEREKYQLSVKMEDFEAQINISVNAFNFAIRSCIEYLGKSHIFEAAQFIDKAIAIQLQIDALFREMERIGLIMAGLTKREFKAMKKEIKQVA